MTKTTIKLTTSQQNVVSRIKQSTKYKLVSVDNKNIASDISCIAPLHYCDMCIESLEQHFMLKETYIIHVGKRGKITVISAQSGMSTDKHICTDISLMGYSIGFNKINMGRYAKFDK